MGRLAGLPLAATGLLLALEMNLDSRQQSVTSIAAAPTRAIKTAIQ